MAAWDHGGGAAAQRLVALTMPALIKSGLKGERRWQLTSIIFHADSSLFPPVLFPTLAADAAPPRQIGRGEIMKSASFRGGGREGEKRMQRGKSTVASLPGLFIEVGNSTCPLGDHSRISAHTRSDVLIPSPFTSRGSQISVGRRAACLILFTESSMSSLECYLLTHTHTHTSLLLSGY